MMRGNLAVIRPNDTQPAVSSPRAPDGTMVEPGSFVAGYRIVTALADGGMSTVYRALDTTLGREVALKVLPASLTADPRRVARFRAEARTVARLEHPNILPIYGFGVDRRTPWMATRLVRGGHLGTRLADGTLSRAELLRVLAAVASALDHAHANGVVHCDLKPQNVLLGELGEVYLADFGIAREASAPARENGRLTGTPSYMAPELALGLEITGSADLYALGVIAYQALTGRLPFTAAYAIDVLLAQAESPVPVEPLAEAGLDERATAIVLRALAKEPAERWTSASLFIVRLAEVLGITLPAPGDRHAQLRSRGRNWLARWRAQRLALRASAITARRPRLETPARARVQPRRRVPFAGAALLGVAVAGAATALALRPDTPSERTAVTMRAMPIAAVAPAAPAAPAGSPAWRRRSEGVSYDDFTRGPADTALARLWSASSPDVLQRTALTGGELMITLSDAPGGHYAAVPVRDAGTELERVTVRVRVDGAVPARASASAGLRLTAAGRADWWVACYLVRDAAGRVTPTCRDSSGASRVGRPLDARLAHSLGIAPDLARGRLRFESNGRQFAELPLPGAASFADARWQLAAHGWASGGGVGAIAAFDEIAIR